MNPLVDGVKKRKGLLGVIGYPIGHTASPAMMNAAIKHAGINNVLYVSTEVHPKYLGAFCWLAHLFNFIGFTVTIPHKVAIIKYLTKLDKSAVEVGAVNVVKVVDERLVGYNTDYIGVLSTLPPELSISSYVTVIGVGGAARAAAIALKKRGFEKLVFVGRRKQTMTKFKRFAKENGIDCKLITIGSEHFIKYVKKSELLINATPVGMYPNINETPVPSKLLHRGMIVFDMIYNPLETRLLREAKKQGAVTINGVKMLIEQGAAALKLWLSMEPDKKVMRRAVLSFLRGRTVEGTGWILTLSKLLTPSRLAMELG
jgi:shikimate dehydrogenase